MLVSIDLEVKHHHDELVNLLRRQNSIPLANYKGHSEVEYEVFVPFEEKHFPELEQDREVNLPCKKNSHPFGRIKRRFELSEAVKVLKNLPIAVAKYNID